jgi:hypothetical protein
MNHGPWKHRLFVIAVVLRTNFVLLAMVIIARIEPRVARPIIILGEDQFSTSLFSVLVRV